MRVGLWVVKEPRAKEHARCLLGLGLTHRCGDFLHVLESLASPHSGDEEVWSGGGPV